MFRKLRSIAEDAEKMAAEALGQVEEAESLSRPIIEDIKAIKRRNHIYESTLQAIRAAR